MINSITNSYKKPHKYSIKSPHKEKMSADNHLNTKNSKDDNYKLENPNKYLISNDQLELHSQKSKHNNSKLPNNDLENNIIETEQDIPNNKFISTTSRDDTPLINNLATIISENNSNEDETENKNYDGSDGGLSDFMIEESEQVSNSKKDYIEKKVANKRRKSNKTIESIQRPLRKMKNEIMKTINHQNEFLSRKINSRYISSDKKHEEHFLNINKNFEDKHKSLENTYEDLKSSTKKKFWTDLILKITILLGIVVQLFKVFLDNPANSTSGDNKKPTTP